MKYLRPYAGYIAASMGVLGGALRMWTLSMGEDGKGLYPSHHAGWLCYLVLTAVMVLFCFLSSRKDAQRRCPAWLPLAGTCVAAVGVLLYSLSFLGKLDFFSMICMSLGLATVGVLLYKLYRQGKGGGQSELNYLVSCLFFTVEMFRLNQNYGGEPELIRFLPQFLAVFSAALACYQLWGKAVELDRRKRRLFWQRLAGYLCIAAAPGAHIMYACVGLWLLSASCEQPVAANGEEPS